MTLSVKRPHLLTLQELLLKCNSGTQKYVDEMESRKASEDEDAKQSTANADNEALEKIMGLVSAHAQALPPPPEAVTAADNFLSSLKSEAEKRDKSAGRDRGRNRRESRYQPHCRYHARPEPQAAHDNAVLPAAPSL